MNPEGTIIGPEGTETIVAVHEAVEIGYSFIWKTTDEVIMSRNGEVLPVEVQHGTPVLPEEICLKLIEEIEQRKREAKRQVMIEVPDEDFELQKMTTTINRLEMVDRKQQRRSSGSIAFDHSKENQRTSKRRSRS
jgi:hypothetical protein